MVQFNTVPMHPEEESIDARVGGEELGEQALRVMAHKHEQSHGDDGNHVNIVEQHRGLNEREEEVVERLKVQEHGDGTYKIATAEQASSANYGRLSSSDYGHSHEQQFASCTCGWRATPEQAMHEMVTGDKADTTGLKYEPGAGKIKYQNDTSNTLEGVASEYSSPMERGGYQ